MTLFDALLVATLVAAAGLYLGRRAVRKVCRGGRACGCSKSTTPARKRVSLTIGATGH